MELIYLWIEDYKNIKKEGFNFSPRFDVKYDKNELTIEPKDYTSIFSSNINVTAIVGENGSGKSGLLEYIENNFNNFEVLEEKKSYSKKNSIFTTIPSVMQIGINKIYYDDIHNTSIHNQTKDLNITRQKTIQNYFSLMHNNKTFTHSKLIDFIKPDYIAISRNVEYVEKLISTFNKNYFAEKLYKELVNDRERTDSNYFFSFKRIFLLFILIERLSNVTEHNNYFSLLEENESIFFNSNLTDEIIHQIIDSNKYNDKYNDIYIKFIKIIEFPNFSMQQNFSLFVEKKELEKEGIYNLLTDGIFFNFFRFDFSSSVKERIYSKLSEGEKLLFSQFVNLFYYIDKEENNDILLLLDEPYNNLHPEWQRVYMNELISFLKNNFPNKNFHIIFTTHSPFLLSDLPKENVIFLEKGKQVYPDIETFGANIHTLLSHGFFMEGGLMGEFAKGKINKAITMLNQSKLDEKEIKFCENIISITGESILKRQMQKMLDGKKLDYIAKDVKEEIEFLKHRIDMLHKRL